MEVFDALLVLAGEVVLFAGIGAKIVELNERWDRGYLLLSLPRRTLDVLVAPVSNEVARWRQLRDAAEGDAVVAFLTPHHGHQAAALDRPRHLRTE